MWLHRRRGVKIGENVFISLGVILESEYPPMVKMGSHVTISMRATVIAHLKGLTRKASVDRELSVRNLKFVDG